MARFYPAGLESVVEFEGLKSEAGADEDFLHHRFDSRCYYSNIASTSTSYQLVLSEMKDIFRLVRRDSRVVKLLSLTTRTRRAGLGVFVCDCDLGWNIISEAKFRFQQFRLER